MLTIYKSFVRPHLDYGDIIYDQPQNESFCNKLESIQYNALLAISGTTWGTSKTKLLKELGWSFWKAKDGLDESVHSIKLEHTISHST